MKNRVITISREFGSGGWTIGKLTARNLNIPCYDSEIITKLVEENDFTEDYVKEHGEHLAQGLINAFLGRTGGLTKQDELWLLQKKLVLELAERGPCMIVGRCADYILRDAADCLTAFIYASLEKRADRIVRVYGEREIIPQERLLFKDKQRAAYYRYYTNMEWGKIQNYHVALDSGALGIERCAEALAGMF